eukprot:CAMPEP_0195536484 /NCGR_PEP_ID=MMETSP0794_2-20130614/46162_1 /TAXON_ID=515487 /ORGANISM="Stephanopyxis turris, Strain CCMP 815" /LENGTH=155 /DNA_ID=CAMNT_0040669913 /DNA_START=107 /DNA_END=571 /DNA_ORIENTATION=-
MIVSSPSSVSLAEPLSPLPLSDGGSGQHDSNLSVGGGVMEMMAEIRDGPSFVPSTYDTWNGENVTTAAVSPLRTRVESSSSMADLPSSNAKDKIYSDSSKLARDSVETGTKYTETEHADAEKENEEKSIYGGNNSKSGVKSTLGVENDSCLASFA